ncbi:MAG: hypothetical protein ABJA81_12440 [Nocardioidaceae bacterium]
MNQQAISEIFFVQEIELAGLLPTELTRELRAICVNELTAHLEGRLRVRDLGLDCHRLDMRAGAVVATVTGWVERLGDQDVVFRIVAAADSAEIVDLSMKFELVPAHRRVPETAPPDVPTSHVGKRDDGDARAVGALRANALQ